MKVVVVGSVESTRAALKVVPAADGCEIAALLTLPPALAGRHSDYVDLSIDASRAGARIIHAPNSNAPDVLDEVARIGPDLTLVIGWSQICKPEFLAAAGDRVVGYHPAPLPQMRGRAAIPWTILLQRTITASTLFWIDAGVDTGPILAQRFLHVAQDETATTLYRRHIEALEEILTESLIAIANGVAGHVAQDERYASWTAKRRPDDGKIDWNQPTADIYRLVRAVTRPYPGAFTTQNDQKLVIWSARPFTDAPRYFGSSGQVIASDGQAFAVRCGDGGALWVAEWEHPSGEAPRMHSILGRQNDRS